MHSNRLLRLVVMFAVVALLGVTLMVPAQRARADANAPRWTAGDFWLYVDVNNANNSVREEVIGRESVQTLLGATYEAWHLRQTATAGSFSLSSDEWIRDADLGLVKTSVTIFTITTITTYDPPQTQASFPLFALKSWGVTVTVAVKVGGGNPTNFTSTLSYQVDGEMDVSVAAGKFHSFSIRTLGTGAYTKLYYSDSAGYWSKRETYNAANQKTGEMDLVQYRYQWNNWTLAAIGLVVGVIAILVLFYLYRKRRQAMGQLGGVAGPRMAPQQYGPMMPPQQPPQGPPPQSPP